METTDYLMKKIAIVTVMIILEIDIIAYTCKGKLINCN